MTDYHSERADLTSLSQLVQDLISGTLRRNTFSPWELEILLDVQTCRIRKSARVNALKRYLKAIQQNFASGAPVVPRFSDFLEAEQRRTPPPMDNPAPTVLTVSCAG